MSDDAERRNLASNFIDKSLENLQFVEEVLGSEILLKGADSDILQGNDFHPMRYMWRSASHFLQRLEQDRLDLQNDCVAFVNEAADCFRRTKGLAGFDAAKPKPGKEMEDPKRYFTWMNEVRTARYFSERIQTEFVPRSNLRTPDLKLSLGSSQAWVECHRTDRPVVRPVADAAYNPYREAMRHLTLSSRTGHDIFILVPGNDPTKIKAAYERAQLQCLEGPRGQYVDPNGGWGFIIADPPEVRRLPGGGLILPQPSSNASASICLVEPAADSSEGVKLVAGRLTICNFDAPGYDEVFGKFLAKYDHCQIPSKDIGVYEFELNLDNIDLNFSYWATSIVANLIAAYTFSHDIYDRAGAILATGGPVITPRTHEGLRFCTLDYAQHLCSRPKPSPISWVADALEDFAGVGLA